MRPRPGGADEFYGVKEYRAGDNPRWIYWRRSARSGTLVSKEMTKVSPPRILLLVDTCVGAAAPADFTAVERAIAMAASLAIIALEQGLSVGFGAWSGDWVTILPTRGKRHRDDLLSMLACLPLNKDHSLTELMDRCQSVLETGTTPILFTPRDLQLGMIDRGQSRTVVVPADSARGRAWFRFDGNIDFSTCMPPDQQPLRGHDAQRRRTLARHLARNVGSDAQR
jgi:uncharacterized protein (DUF58 family)